VETNPGLMTGRKLPHHITNASLVRRTPRNLNPDLGSQPFYRSQPYAPEPVRS
jgi:hypothetical protein